MRLDDVDPADSDRFLDGDTPWRMFDVIRPGNDHITFGEGGPHVCLGNAPARLEIRIMFEELLPRIPGIRLAGEPRRVRSNFVNGIKDLPVTVTLA